jgi:phospholipid/cholesterol/gamma-HCH transport system permease protein
LTPVALDDRIRLERGKRDVLEVLIRGAWALEDGIPPAEDVVRALESEGAPRRLRFEAEGDLGKWDTSLVTYVHSLAAFAVARGIAVDTSALPEGARKLVALALAVKPQPREERVEDDAITARVGRVALGAWGTLGDALSFLGETALAGAALLRGRAGFRRVDLLYAFETSGVGALGIVALINFLIGAVLAFVGAVQLQQFGAAIFVADLVAIGVARELGALMTGIVMAGRTGASYAAVLGTMQVGEEVDALQTMGLRPIEFLVLPRVTATALMMPALVAYADVMGLLGGLFVATSLLGVGTTEYVRQTQGALALRHVFIGLGKSVAFGVVVAITGCYYGIRCGRSAGAVGEATTRAVVMSIVLVVVVDAVFTVVLYALGL